MASRVHRGHVRVEALLVINFNSVSQDLSVEVLSHLAVKIKLVLGVKLREERDEIKFSNVSFLLFFYSFLLNHFSQKLGECLPDHPRWHGLERPQVLFKQILVDLVGDIGLLEDF